MAKRLIDVKGSARFICFLQLRYKEVRGNCQPLERSNISEIILKTRCYSMDFRKVSSNLVTDKMLERCWGYLSI